MEKLVIYNENRQPVTTSLLVAQKFGKRHADVLRAIKDLLKQMPENEHERNFALTFNEVKTANGATRKDPFYVISRDGFTLLAMGFTGKEAVVLKISYIKAFNHLFEENKRLREQQFKALGGYDIVADFNESVRTVEIREEKYLSLVDVLKFIRSGSNASDVSKRHPDIGAFKMRYPGLVQAEYFGNAQGIGYLLKHYSKLGNKTAKALWNLVFTDVPMKGLN